MASYRYTRDFKQDDNAAQGARQPMTAKQKRQNFWFYYKWHVIGILVVIAVIVFTALSLTIQLASLPLKLQPLICLKACKSRLLPLAKI